MTLTPTELRTLAHLAEKFAALAIDLARACGHPNALPPAMPERFARLLTEAVDDHITGKAWIALSEDTLAIVKAAEKAK